MSDKREEEMRAAIQKLQAFKDYVHKRLDDAGIPANPDGEHSKQGCRIGDRLDIVLPSAETAMVNELYLEAFILRAQKGRHFQPAFSHAQRARCIARALLIRFPHIVRES